MKLITIVIFTLDGSFFKYIDKCTMGGPLSMKLSDICMVKMDVVTSTEAKFYHKYVDVS